MIPIAAYLTSAWASAALGMPQSVRFERVVLDDQVGIGYGVAVADVDGDGRRDVLLVDRDEVRWYRAPDWTRIRLCGRLTELDHVCIAARDVAGYAKAEIALGAGWNPGDTTGSGAVFVASPGADPLAEWTPRELEREPTVHRMRWVRGRGGAATLLMAPLHGRGNVNGQGEGVRLLEYAQVAADAGATGWRATPIPTPFHQTHNFDVVEWDGDEGEEMVVAGREGLFLFDRGEGGDPGAWTWTPLVGPDHGQPEFRGASEVRLGRFGNGRRYLATIEPFHGHELCAYVEPRRPGEPWSRTLLDATLAEGHALACGDLLRRGDEQLAVGWRKPDASGKTGLKLLVPLTRDPPDRAGAGGPPPAALFDSFTIDGSVACEDLAIADLDGDGRLDLVAAGRDSHDLVLLLNRCDPPPRDRDGALLPPCPRPDRAPMHVASLDSIDAVVAEAIEAGEMPGCVVCIGRSDGIALLRAYGDRAVVPEREPMTTDTLFDLASLTKPIATATCVVQAFDGGVGLDERLVHGLLPRDDGAEPGGWFAEVTLRHCLLHTAGFVPDNDLADYQQGVGEAWRRLLALQPSSRPGTSFVYSDVGYELLGAAVERAGGVPLEERARRDVFAPLGMRETCFNPGSALRERIAPTEMRDGVMLRGVVHDPRAALLGGVAGHAGLFSTASDLSRYARMLLRGGELDFVRVLSPGEVALLTTAERVPGGAWRTPGFDADSRFSSNRGEGMTTLAFGHGGFTGTGLWIDPGLDLFVIFLSSRLHPDGKGLVNPLIGRIGSMAAASIGRPTDLPAVPIRVGADVLRDGRFERLRGARVGLITNHTGRASDGTSTIALLASEEARRACVTLVAILTPEHGLTGLEDARVADGVEQATGTPVRSLYGEDRKPTPAMLEDLDTLVFDVQDAGARCYTYISTLGLCMEAAAEQGKRFVVLDRPDPIGGDVVAGPLPDPGRESFTCYHSIPLRHGMTVGELARLYRAEKLPAVVGAGKAAALDLHVVTMDGWRRCDRFDATGIPWVNPSPNLRSLDAALLYPGLVLFEPTNLSVGRGTELPFHQVGAPWLDAAAVVASLGEGALPGARAVAVEFTSASSKFADEPCRGLRVEIVDRAALEPMRIALEIAAAIARRHPDQWQLEKMDALLCHRASIDALRAGRPIEEILASWRRDAASFEERRAPWLLYR